MKPQVPADIPLSKWLYWGFPDQSRKIADGFYLVSTPSHGGYIVSQDRLEKMPKEFREVGYGADRGCFEEDCAWALPVLFYPAEYRAYSESLGLTDTDQVFDAARRTVAAMYPAIAAAHPYLMR